MSNQLLIIFVRNPEPGKVKTRLIPRVGAKGACRIYEWLLKHTSRMAQGVDAHIHVWYASGPIPGEDRWSGIATERNIQPEGADLGKRMETAFSHAFALGATRVVIIGSDCPALDTTHLESAFATLAEQDAVIGPALDGGYYLLGLRKPVPDVFSGKSWSTETVCIDTEADLVRLGLTYTRLETLRDIDEPADLDAYPELMNQWGFQADQPVEQVDSEPDEKAAHGQADP